MSSEISQKEGSLSRLPSLKATLTFLLQLVILLTTVTLIIPETLGSLSTMLNLLCSSVNTTDLNSS